MSEYPATYSSTLNECIGEKAKIKLLILDIDGVLTDGTKVYTCLLYTSPSPRDRQKSRMPSSA